MIMDINSLTIEEAGMSVRSTNALHRASIHTIGDMLKQTEDTLSEINNLGKKSISEILDKIDYYKQLCAMSKSAEAMKASEEAGIPKNREIISEYLSISGVSIDALELLPARAYNYLLLNGYNKLEDVIFLTEDELMLIRVMDDVSAGEIVKACKRYVRTMWSSICEFANKKAEEQCKEKLSVSELLADM